jgi:hypothetical protein
MTKKQTNPLIPQSEKILALAGLAIVIIGCIANLYGAYINRRFIHDFIDPLYYFHYLIILGGGFLTGYLAVKKSSKLVRDARIFMGVSYATLAMMLYWLCDLLRFALQNVVGMPSYPWGKIYFEGGAIITLVAVVVIAYFSQRRPNRTVVSTITKGLLVGSFGLTLIYSTASEIHDLMVGTASFDANFPLWLNLINYLTSPLAVAILGYVLLSKIKRRFDRLFYAILIAALYGTLSTILWEFRVDATYEATNIFNSVVVTLSLLFVTVLLWRVRKATK